MSGPVFLTGGSGFVGNALLRAVLADGREVRALARSEATAEALLALGATVVQSSMSTTDSHVFTSTGSRPFTMSSSNVADPPVRPGPCTDEGFTLTTAMPSSSPRASTRRSPRNFDRS